MFWIVGLLVFVAFCAGFITGGYREFWRRWGVHDLAVENARLTRELAQLDCLAGAMARHPAGKAHLRAIR